MTPLAQRPCRDLCRWAPDPRKNQRPAGAPRLFRCRGCGSQWDRNEQWTPRNADGTTSADIRTETKHR